MAATLDTRHARFTVRHPSLLTRVLPLVRALDAVVERRTCGANAPGGGGFQPGNKCGKGDGVGGGAPSGEASEAVKAWAQKAFSNPSHAENFVRWFGDSKVVGDNGEPLLVHKGMPRKDWKTGQEIDAVQSTNGPWAGFFSDDKAVADRFAQAFKFSGDTQTLSGYAVIRKPHVIDAGGKPAKSVQFDQVVDGPSGPKVQVAPRIKEIIDSGQYDGIIIKNTSDEGTVFVPFNPESVKSSDNSGAFDPKSKNYKRYESRECGANAPGGGGFQPGNKCGKGDGGGGSDSEGESSGGSGKATPEVKAWAEEKFDNPEHAKAFAGWFGDSRVVDEKGEPLVVYHGTKASFDEFSGDAAGSNIDSGKLGQGFYFSTRPELAGAYAASGKGSDKSGAKTIAAYLSISNPLEIDTGGGDVFSKLKDYSKQAGITDEPLTSDGNPNPVWSKKFTQRLQDFGYDGISLKISDGDTEYVAFQPTQIKSATGNSGTFDPKDPRITRSLLPESRECDANAPSGGDRRAWCPGASPPDNSCSPHNKGGKGGGGGGGASGGGSGKKGSSRPKQFDPSKSADRLVKKLSALDAKMQKKIDAAAKRVEKAKDAAAVAIQKMQSLDSAWISTREAWGADPENKAKERAHMRVQKQIEKAAQVHQDKVAAYAAAKEKHASAFEEKAKAGREALKQEMAREVADIAAADGMAAAHASARRSVEVAHADRLKRIRDPEARARIADGYAFMLEHTNPDIHKIALQPQLSVRGNVRAYAQRGGFDRETFEAISPPTVVVSSRESASVVAHELGHCVEYNPEATRIARDFKERRVAGTTEVSFRSKFGYGYKSDERGSPDDFKKAHLAAGFDEKEADHRAHYTGKRYSSGSTEIVSMGVELLKRDPAAFARSDPEWFSLTTGLMTGRLLSETRQKRKAKS